MAYLGRVVGVGLSERYPLGFFGLASRSDHDRSLRVNAKKQRIEVVPTGDSLETISKYPQNILDHTGNLYAPVWGSMGKDGKPVIIVSNGNMGKYLKDQITLRDETILFSMSRTLCTLPPKEPNDPRMVAIISGLDRPEIIMGTYSTDDKSPEVGVLDDEPIGANSLIYTALTAEKKRVKIEVPEFRSPDKLAEMLYRQIYGNPAEHGIGAGVCLFCDDEFKFGVFIDPMKK